MKESTVLIVHNHYQQPGGEDRVFASETALVEAKGHRVIRYEDNNARIKGPSAAIDTIWSRNAASAIRRLVRKHKPDVVHFHNTFPLISPAAYYAVQREGVPVVQTLHNFRLICPGATLFRDGHVCEDCIEKRSFRPAMAHKCYRGSHPATAATAAMLTVHNTAGTWQRKVDTFIALSEFSRRKFVAGGLPSAKIVVKPNFITPDPGPGNGAGRFALFAGRLSPEKGISTMIEAWKTLPDIPLLVAGDVGQGHALPQPFDATAVTFIGRQSHDQVLSKMRDARLLIFPSTWYEGAPMTILEAFACGLPVIASNLGSMAEIVDDKRTGLLFEPGNAQDLARKVRWAWEHPEALASMRLAARKEYEEKYSADRNYQLLMAIYEGAIRARN